MSEKGFQPGDAMDGLVGRIVASYQSFSRLQHIDATFLPSRTKTIEILELLRRLIFPGFFDEHRLSTDSIDEHVRRLLEEVSGLLYEQIRHALRCAQNRRSDARRGDACDACDVEARKVTLAFLDRVPDVRRMLSLDLQAAYDGDPAAVNTDEVIFCYPGLDAVFTHRVAHELYKLKVPMLPRMMSEYAHNETGIDIHPGATIGESFFIDHGTGVVIGETCVIGRHVQIYQGVTLGALAPKDGQMWRGRRRHPTIEDHVTIYGGAIILGGETVIGEGAEIGGSVFLTRSVPPYHKVRMEGTTPKVSDSKSLRRRVEQRTAPTEG